MKNSVVLDPYELVKDLADRIGIHQLYAIARDIRGEGCENGDEEVMKLKMEIEELKHHIEYSDRREQQLIGIVEGLKFAIRCNGISGAEIHADER